MYLSNADVVNFRLQINAYANTKTQIQSRIDIPIYKQKDRYSQLILKQER